ncbi:MAG: RcnB family protein [Acidobacteriia bacterium]|nr:RcnB family protein [Terriglobia bacterium]
MRSRTWLYVFVAVLFALVGPSALAQGHSGEHGHGHGHDKAKHHDRDDDDRGHDFYHGHDRYAMREWYEGHYDRLPPGLAKRDRLPPGLERQLMVRGTLPPGLRKKLHPCPPEFVQMLPPPPPDCEHVLIGGHVVLMNRRSFLVVDIFHLEL